MDGQGVTSDLFYTSIDGGATWRKLPAPQFNPTNQGWTVEVPTGSQPWRICGVEGPTSPNGNGVGAQPATMTCSIDGGQTWVDRPALNVVENSPKGAQFYAPGDAFVIVADGGGEHCAVESPMHVYRLSAGGSVWQDLGPQPNSSTAGPAYYPSSSGGVLWSGGVSAFTATYPLAQTSRDAGASHRREDVRQCGEMLPTSADERRRAPLGHGRVMGTARQRSARANGPAALCILSRSSYNRSVANRSVANRRRATRRSWTRRNGPAGGGSAVPHRCADVWSRIVVW